MSPLFPAPRSADLGSAGAICASAGACAYAGVQPSAPAVPSISPILMRFFILYLSLPLYFSQAGWLLWQPVALARFQTALMQEVITPDFQLTCRLDLARLTTEADRKSTRLNSSH